MSNELGVAPQFEYGQSDHADTPVTIFAGPALVRAVYITEAPNASVGIDDGTTADVFIIPSSTGVGTKIDLSDVMFTSSVILDYGAASAGKVTVVYAKNHDGLADDGPN